MINGMIMDMKVELLLLGWVLLMSVPQVMVMGSAADALADKVWEWHKNGSVW